MRHIPPVRSNGVISKYQQRLLSILLGLALAVGQCAFLYLSFPYFQFNPSTLSDPTLIYLWILLDFVAAIPPSFYIARETGGRYEGLVAGRVTGCTAALLTTIVQVVYYTLILPLAHLQILPHVFMVICINIITALAAFAGAFIGSRFGAPPPV
jgi:hypothetical protein